MDITAKCDECGKKETLSDIHPTEWGEYLNGALVQDVWPNLSAEEREILIGARTKTHLCSECWDKCFSEEEKES